MSYYKIYETYNEDVWSSLMRDKSPSSSKIVTVITEIHTFLLYGVRNKNWILCESDNITYFNWLVTPTRCGWQNLVEALHSVNVATASIALEKGYFKALQQSFITLKNPPLILITTDSIPWRYSGRGKACIARWGLPCLWFRLCPFQLLRVRVIWPWSWGQSLSRVR